MSPDELLLQRLQKQVASKQGQLITRRWPGARGSVIVRCAQGHTWKTEARYLQRGAWCPSCRADRLEEMQQLAKNRGGSCLSAKYHGPRVPLHWKCVEGHTWKTKPVNIRRGRWCPECASRKATLADIQELARRWGGQCLSKVYMHSKHPLRWRCSEGHEWKSAWHNVRDGSWCHICQLKRLSIDDLRQAARSRGGQCLSVEYQDVTTPMEWRCADGHRWKAAWRNIRGGAWCPTCAIQNRTGTLAEMKTLAAERGGECLSNRYTNSDHRLRWRCAEGHVWLAKPTVVKAGNWCPDCSPTRRLTLAKMQEVAKQRGGECLSKRYTNSSTKLRWRCAQGHEWQAKPGNVLHRNSWCPTCGNRRMVLFRKARSTAKTKGGASLSKRMDKTDELLRWRCAKGHEFGRKAQSVIDGKWCPKC